MQLSESLTESIVPFDATSETPLEEQRTEAMVRVQDALLVRLGPEALALLRAARSAILDTPLTPVPNHTSLGIKGLTIFFTYSGRCGQREMCLVQLMWNLKRNWNSLSRSCMPTCQVSFKNAYLRDPLYHSICAAFKPCILILGSSAPEPVVEEEDFAAELEEEEFESVQISEKEFNFLDFIKR